MGGWSTDHENELVPPLQSQHYRTKLKGKYCAIPVNQDLILIFAQIIDLPSNC